MKLLNINNKSGFTLVELLVVISIIAILTVVTVGSFSGSQKKSRDAARKSNLKSLSEAIGVYYADTGSFPPSISFGGELSFGSGSSEIIYMKKTPAGVGYTYFVSTSRRSFRLITNLENDGDKDCHCYKSGGSNNPTCSSLGYTITSGCGYIITSSNVGATDSGGSFP